MIKSLNSLAVFCGSSSGLDPIYEQSALELARELVDREITLVFGGGSIGLMGIMADEMMSRGGKVIGVIPQKLMEWEVGHTGITKLHVVESMHDRKALMAELSEGFIALPGGIGTLEEIIEVYTWQQLGYHAKPCAFLNVNGYYDRLFSFFDQMVAEGFLKPEHRENLIIRDNAKDLFHAMES